MQEQRNWTMITAIDISTHNIIANGRLEAFREDKIVESPADISGACVAQIRPVGVATLSVRVQIAKRVDESRFQQFCETVSLFYDFLQRRREKAQT
ncbi:hypothetical protein LSTR_LSTR010631 [Laodelphax striatellus]|uniref:Uncharacterized protein n=1 Tax=Laodelphax striatellus TaxID=195883 RepID=A0A482X410_LAOST|nr:hypothetical protein LSTR_LSTR010631 [Laodelphax striatellus]